MEAKKNPRKDVHRKSPLFFVLGLLLSTTLVISAFEWETKKETLPLPGHDIVEASMIVDNTIYITPPDQTSPTPFKKTIVNEKVIAENIVPVSESEPIDEKIPEILFNNPELNSTATELEPEPGIEIVAFPERNAMPINGMEGFYNLLRKNLKYPKQAISLGVEGKVFVEFIVNKNGEPSDIKVTRGIGAGCDEEAMRVIGLSRWEPGRQRGNPVRVRMTMPIIFSLNR